MAKDWKLDDHGDIDMSTGDLQWVEDEEELAQLVETKILKIYDEDYIDQERGVDWFNTMYDFNRDLKFKLLALKAAIVQIPEVTNIIQLDMDKDRETQRHRVEVQMDSIFSEEPVRINK